MTPTMESYTELITAFDYFNDALFNGSLPACLITLQRKKNTLGYLFSKRFKNSFGLMADELAMNPNYFALTPVSEIMQTLCHEMVHLWQIYNGKPGRGRYHNKEWASKMEAIGLMPSSTGKPGGAKTGDSMNDYIIANGEFEKALNKLLESDFKISWHDRFPPAKLVNEFLENVANSDELTETQEALHGLQFELEPVKQTRTKYACECITYIWGKSNLNVICGVCEQVFEEVDG